MRPDLLNLPWSLLFEGVSHLIAPPRQGMPPARSQAPVRAGLPACGGCPARPVDGGISIAGMGPDDQQDGGRADDVMPRP